ncbi:glycosyltransferase family 2 protein [Paracoccus tegillarcae]|nr:glycosyltransferase family 2 protein [Paracoccus tegillarcae]
MVLCEDEIEVPATLRSHLSRGFRHILALSPEPLDLPDNITATGRVTNLIHDTRRPDAHVPAVNALINAVPEGTWLHYGFNAEFLFYPFCETRSVGEMLTFHAEERRDAMLAYVIDLYAPDLSTHPDAVSLDNAMFDRTGYYALGRKTADGSGYEERQLDFHGGLRWRMEEHVPADRRRIDRIALFRARKGLRLTADHRFNDPEYNTYACPWHHNLTCVMASFRAAKALARNPMSRDQISGFTWRNSTRFDWNGQQLLDLGLMEPGQWF